MTEITNYRIDFVERTKEILQENYPEFKDNNREVTFLLNCLLGLIITVSENEKKLNKVFKGNIDNDFLKFIPEKIGFVEKTNNIDLTDKDLTIFELAVCHKTSLIKETKLWFVNKIRNCIAHQNIEGMNENGKWIGVRLWNQKDSTKDFEIIFTVEEIKNLAIELATQYLKFHKINSEIRKLDY